jgi:hypothetical protein
MVSDRRTTVDDGSTQAAEDLGTIKLVIQRMTNYKALKCQEQDPKRPRVHGSDKVDEKAKKSATHRVE